MIYFRLFIEFFKTGLFAVGGGLATLPFLYEMAEKTGWFTAGDVADMIAISESTPGAIGINMATYAGFRTAGLAGSLCATVGLIMPSIIIILIVASFLKRFRDNKYVDSAFKGLRPASMAMITAAGLNVVKIALFDFSVLGSSDRTSAIDLGKLRGNIDGLFLWKAWILAIVIVLAMQKFKKIHPIVFIGIAAVVGIIFQF